MKILLVEDDGAKLRHVLTVLQEVPGCSLENIVIARDAADAKGKLRSDHYDLLVLDIALPARSDASPTPDGGARLLEELLSRSIYKKPREIVGLTAFQDVRETVGPRFAEDLWDVILYDPSSDAWSEQLKRKIKYIQMASKPGAIVDYATDLCVVTALVNTEFEAVLALPWKWKDLEQPGDGMVYKRGEYKNNGRSHSVIVAVTPRMGMTASALLASKMIFNFRPRYIAMTGIAAGIRGECEVGDILVADPVWDWGSGKRFVEGGSPVFAAAPHQLALNSFVRGKVSALARDHEVLNEIRERWQGHRPNTVLSMHIGPVASGAAVLADGSITETIKDQHRKLMGIDMEIYGVFGAADEALAPIPKAFALKSVCDFADEQKADGFQKYAAYTSAQALKILVEQYLT
jgi:nucleoside phosphorylase